MKKITSATICLILCAGFMFAPHKTSANTTNSENDQQIQLLYKLIELLQKQLVELMQASNPGNTVGFTNLDQKEFNTIVKGTPLEGHVFSLSKRYVFTDGKGGEDTVMYKNKKSYYTFYNGNDIPSKGYKNPVIVTGEKDDFVEIDVNSEYIQFSDQTISIPDFKVVSSEVDDEDTENLSISSITLSSPDGIGGSSVGAVPDQTITVEVKNNEFGSVELSGKKFEYAVYLYEVVNGDRIKLLKAATGVALVPNANGYSEFEASIEGGLPFDGEDFERTYQALIKIDTGGDVTESNEKDNSKWTNEWMVDYYKG